MPEIKIETKVSILACLASQKEFGSNVTQLAERCNVSKATASRAVAWCEERGLAERVQAKGGRQRIRLNAQGMRLAAEYEQKHELSMAWMLTHGVVREIAEIDALVMSRLSEETTNVFRQSVVRRLLQQKLEGLDSFGGTVFCAPLPDESYPVPFAFHRSFGEYSAAPSMANGGFEAPAELVVAKGVGRIVLKAKPLEHTSALGPFSVRGILDALRYFDGGGFVDADKESDLFAFPAAVLAFSHVNGAQVFQGSALLRMSCSVGESHMPESDAVFTMYF